MGSGAVGGGSTCPAQAQAARHDFGGRSAWSQIWRARRKWEEERRRESTAEAVAGRRRAARGGEDAARRLAAAEEARRRRAAVLKARRVRKAEAKAARRMMHAVFCLRGGGRDALCDQLVGLSQPVCLWL